MILVPLLTWTARFQEDELFPASIAVMLPICVVSLVLTSVKGNLPWQEAIPYLLGSGIGGFVAGKWGRKIPVLWLHRGLGLLILWGGIRYLC